MREYEMLMEAKNLQSIDKLNDMHLQAWANNRAKATKNKGSDRNPKIVPLYETYTEFFDYEKAIDNYWNGEEKGKTSDSEKQLMELVKKANKKGGS